MVDVAGGAEYAGNPEPGDNEEYVVEDITLSWTSGNNAAYHDVYFGTDAEAVSEAGRLDGDTDGDNEVDFDDLKNLSLQWLSEVCSNPEPSDFTGDCFVDFRDFSVIVNNWGRSVDGTVFKGRQATADNSYDPVGLEYGRTYYWRVDEINDSYAQSPWRGEVWEFKVRFPAFPGAEGAGMWSKGGRGGWIYKVTNLDDSGYGSLRQAVESSWPRIVVFRVSGTIALNSELVIDNPCITIAGQTAPGEGICLKNYEMQIRADDVIIRHLKFRAGDNRGGAPDALNIKQGHNIIIDHCSATWGVDETLSVYTESGLVDKVTVQWCLIGESLNCSTHPKGCHGFGSAIRGGVGAVYSFHHNVYAHHYARNPMLGSYPGGSPGLIFDFRNNVVYNWGRFPGHSCSFSEPDLMTINYIGNYFKPGPSTSWQTATDAFGQYWTPYAIVDMYVSGNIMTSDPPAQYNNWRIIENPGGYICELPTAVDVPPVSTEDASTALDRVTEQAGATRPFRDSVDTRIINDVLNGTGGIIDDETEVGGWPFLSSSPPPTDSDYDGMPDSWENERGLNPNYYDDCMGDDDNDGYTNIEEYLNELAEMND